MASCAELTCPAGQVFSPITECLCTETETVQKLYPVWATEQDKENAHAAGLVRYRDQSQLDSETSGADGTEVQVEKEEDAEDFPPCAQALDCSPEEYFN